MSVSALSSSAPWFAQTCERARVTVIFCGRFTLPRFRRCIDLAVAIGLHALSSHLWLLYGISVFRPWATPFRKVIADQRTRHPFVAPSDRSSRPE